MWITALAALPEGRLVSATSVHDPLGKVHPSTLSVSQTKTNQRVAMLQGHELTVWALAALPKDNLASAGEDRIIRLWNLRNGTEVGRLVGHQGAIRGLLDLHDGRLASAGDDKTIRVWDLTTRTEVARFEVDASVLSLAELDAGRLIVAGDEMGRLHWLEIAE
jgi:WD40 repeat protein